MPQTHIHPEYLALPTIELFDKFGSGGHKPGSGSAAALMGLLSAKLAVTVCKLTLNRPRYESVHSEVNHTMDRMDNEFVPELKRLFQQDSERFHLVYQTRVSRDNATSDKDKNRFKKQEQERLRSATIPPLKIAKLCIRLIDHGIFLFDRGFQSARGDSGAAISAAIAGASAAAFVIRMNLMSTNLKDWKERVEGDVRDLLAKLESKQQHAFAKITQLSEKEISTMTLKLK
jgi:formiminotetrahydrofolate cyclodeaminase